MDSTATSMHGGALLIFGPGEGVEHDATTELAAGLYRAVEACSPWNLRLAGGLRRRLWPSWEATSEGNLEYHLRRPSLPAPDRDASSACWCRDCTATRSISPNRCGRSRWKPLGTTRPITGSVAPCAICSAAAPPMLGVTSGRPWAVCDGRRGSPVGICRRPTPHRARR